MTNDIINNIDSNYLIDRDVTTIYFNDLNNLILIQIKCFKIKNIYYFDNLDAYDIKGIDKELLLNMLYPYFNYDVKNNCVLLKKHINIEDVEVLHNILTFLDKTELFLYIVERYRNNNKTNKCSIFKIHECFFIKIEYLEEHIKGLKEKDKDGNLDKAIENATKALKNFQKLQKGFKSKDKLVFIKKDFEPWREGTFAAITFLTLLNLENVVELGINKNTNFFDQSIKTQTEYITHELLHVEDIYHNIDGSGPWYSNPYYLSTPFNWKIECANE